MLPSKTVPTTGCGSGKRKRNKVTVEEVEDEDSPQNLRAQSPVATGSSIIEDNSLYQKSQRQSTRNPIYYFYERVEHDAKGSVGNIGDKHYKCLHGNRKVSTITKAMKSSLNGCLLYIFFLSNINSRHHRSHWKSQDLLTRNVSSLHDSQESLSPGSHYSRRDRHSI